MVVVPGKWAATDSNEIVPSSSVSISTFNRLFMLYKFSRLKLNLKQEPIVPSQNQVIIRFALKQIKEKGRINKKKTHRHCSNKKLYKPALCPLSCIFSPIQSYWQQSHISSARSWSRGIIKKQRGQYKILHSWIRTKGHMLLIQYSGPFGKIQTFGVQPEDNIFRWAYSLCFLSMLINEAAYEA